MTTTPKPNHKQKLLDAALHVIRAKGYTATTVDDICHHAGVTKGSFFHHFKSKEDLAVQAAAHFGAMAAGLFATAPYQSIPDPRDRFLGYIDFRIAILQGQLPQFTCLLGTMVQEVYDTHPLIRQACQSALDAHLESLTKDIQAARDQYEPDADWTAQSLALHTQAVIQGSFIFAKAQGSPAPAVECLKHLRRYVESLFPLPQPF
jgi:TetR/AcrR family transcriptional regulator, transcriptional repressor for nem operon